MIGRRGEVRSLLDIVSRGVACRVGGLAIGLVNSVLLARILGPEQFGQYSFLLTVAELLMVIALFGTPPLLLREVSTGIGNKSYGKVRGLLTWARNKTILLSIPLMLLALVLYTLWSSSAGCQLTIVIVLIPMSLILFEALSRQAINVLQGLGRIVASQALSIMAGPGFFLIFLLGTFAIIPGWLTLENVLILLLISRLLSLLFIELIKKQCLPFEFFYSEPEFFPTQWNKSALPLLFVGSMLIVNSRIDIVMLGYMGDSIDVGLYRVAQRGSQLILFGVMAVDSFIGPLAAKSWAQTQKEELQKVITQSNWLVLLFTLPLFGLYVFVGKDLLNFIYGHAYSGSWCPLVILSCGYFSQVLFGRGGLILSMSHFERETAIVVAIGTGSNVILNLLLIPNYGIIGAAFATALALIIRVIVEAIVTYYKTGINTTMFFVSKTKT